MDYCVGSQTLFELKSIGPTTGTYTPGPTALMYNDSKYRLDL